MSGNFYMQQYYPTFKRVSTNPDIQRDIQAHFLMRNSMVGISASFITYFLFKSKLLWAGPIGICCGLLDYYFNKQSYYNDYHHQLTRDILYNL